MHRFSSRFIAAYMFLGATVLVAWGGAAWMMTLPAPVKDAKHVVHIQDLGATDIGKLAQQAIASTAPSNGVVIKSQKVVKITADKKDPNVSYVDVKVEQVGGGTITLRVTLSKGIYQVNGISLVGGFGGA